MKLVEPDEIRTAPSRTFKSYFTDLKPGLVMEFGTGQSTYDIVGSTADDVGVYGFDCLEGLPENWEGRLSSPDKPMHPAGSFKSGRPNIDSARFEMVVGLFQDTLVPFLAEHPGLVSFIHVDCDLYSSTKVILDAVKDRVQDGTVIVFDELIDYGNEWCEEPWRDHEFKAFNEFLAETDWDWTCLGTHGDCKFGFRLKTPETEQ